MWRNSRFAKVLTVLFYLLFEKDAKYLDYAGGYGVFVRLMRDIGFDFYWSDKYTQNLFACGFEGKPEERYQAITLFEVVEHFVNPKEELLRLSKSTDLLIFSTEFYPKNNPKPSEWWYFGLEHGQHVSIFSEKTVMYIADELGWKYYRLGNLKLLSKYHIPRWKLLATKGVRLCLDRWIERKFNSKTWSDFLYITQKKLRD